MKLVDGPNCLYCGSEESLIHAFLEYENVTKLRSMELWLRDVLDRHVNKSEIDKIFWINNGDKLLFHFCKPKKRNRPFLFIFLLAEPHGYAVSNHCMYTE